MTKTIYLRVKIIPGSPKNEIIEQRNDGTLKIRIAASPEKGKANKELLKFLSEKYNTSKSDIAILSGKTERTKLIRINA